MIIIIVTRVNNSHFFQDFFFEYKTKKEKQKGDDYVLCKFVSCFII